MSNVGQFHAELILDTDRFESPADKAAKSSDRLTAAVGAGTAATELHAASAARAGLAVGTYAGASAAAAIAAGPLSMIAGRMTTQFADVHASLGKLNTTLGSGVALLRQIQDRMVGAVGEFGEFIRTSVRGDERMQALGSAMRSFSAQADLAAGKLNTVGFAVRLSRRELSHFERVLVDNKRHGPILRGLAAAAIGMDIGFSKAANAITGTGSAIGKLGKASRNWLRGDGGGISGWTARFRAQLGDLSKYLGGAFGPALTDTAKIFTRVIGPAARETFGAVGNVISRSLQPLSAIDEIALAIQSRLSGFADIYGKIGQKLTVLQKPVLATANAARKLAGFFEEFAFAGRNTVVVVGGLGQMFARAGHGIQRFVKRHPALAKFISSMVRGVTDAALALGSLGMIAGAAPTKKVIAWFQQTSRVARDLGKILGPVVDRIGKAASAAVSGFTRVAGGAIYMTREVGKGIATVIRMGGALIKAAGQATRAGVYVAALTAKLTVMGMGALKAALSFLPLILRSRLLTNAVIAVGGAFVPMVRQLGAVAKAIPIVGHAVSAASKVFGGLGRVIGRASKTLIGLATAATMAGGAIAIMAGGAALGLLIRSQMKAGAEIAKTADKIGVQTEALIGLQHAARLKGVDDLDNKLSSLRDTMRDAEPDSPIARSIGEAGVSLDELRRQSPDKQMATIADAMKNMSDHADRVRLATQLFGDEGQAMARMLADGSDGLNAAAADAEKLGLSIDRVDAATFEQANVAIDRLKQLFVGIGRQLAVKVVPFIEAAANKLVGFGTAGGGVGKTVDRALRWVVDRVVSLLDWVSHVIIGFQKIGATAIEFGAKATRAVADFIANSETLTDWARWLIDGFGRLRINVVRMFGAIYDGMASLAPLLPQMPEWLGGGKAIDPNVFRFAGASMEMLANKFEREFEESRFTFDPMAESMNKAADKMESRAKKLRESIEKQEAGDTLGTRFREWGRSIVEDARRRAQETADQVEAGLNVAGEKFDEARQKMAGHAGALEHGSVAAFSAALGRADEAAARVSRAPSTPSVNASTPQQQQQQQGKCCDGVETTNQLLSRMLVIWEEWKRDRDAGEGVEIGLGAIP